MKPTTIIIFGFAVVVAMLAYVVMKLRPSGPEITTNGDTTGVGPARGVEAVESALGAMNAEFVQLYNKAVGIEETTTRTEEELNAGISALGNQATDYAMRAEELANINWQNQQAIAGVYTQRVIGEDGSVYYLKAEAIPADYNGTPAWAASFYNKETGKIVERTLVSQLAAANNGGA